MRGTIKIHWLKKKKASLSGWTVAEKAEGCAQLLTRESSDTRLSVLGRAAWGTAEPAPAARVKSGL